MRAVISRVFDASVQVDGKTVGSIEQGLLVYLGVSKEDSLKDVAYIADKIAKLRVFNDDAGKLNLNVQDKDLSILVISQFTLAGDLRKGNRPSFSSAALAADAEQLYLATVAALRAKNLKVSTGKFQANMRVSSTGNGPVTLLLDSNKKF